MRRRRALCADAFQAASAEGLQAEAFVDTQITRPSLSLNVAGPETARVGEQVQFRIEVTNAAEQMLDNVTITDRFDAALEHAEGLASPIQKILGRLDPGQTKVFAVTFIVRRSGQICHALEVSAPGGQYAQKQVCVNVTEAAITAQPRLEVTKTAVNEARTGASVQFSSRIANTGNVMLTNVRITDYYDPEYERLEASAGWDPTAWAAGELVWIVPQLAPGESIQRDVLCLCRQAAEAAVSRVLVTAAENISEMAQTSVRILPGSAPPAAPGIPGVPGSGAAAPGSLSLDISEFGDPIKVGERTAYMITLRNDRASPDQDLVIQVELPRGFSLSR